jgi:hypothetical protein
MYVMSHIVATATGSTVQFKFVNEYLYGRMQFCVSHCNTNGWNALVGAVNQYRDEEVTFTKSAHTYRIKHRRGNLVFYDGSTKLCIPSGAVGCVAALQLMADLCEAAPPVVGSVGQ